MNKNNDYKQRSHIDLNRLKEKHKNNTYLVLTRSVDDKIFIGENIEIVVCDIDRKNVRIGISAPSDVVILRDNVRQGEPKQ